MIGHQCQYEGKLELLQIIIQVQTSDFVSFSHGHKSLKRMLFSLFQIIMEIIFVLLLK